MAQETWTLSVCGKTLDKNCPSVTNESNFGQWQVYFTVYDHTYGFYSI